MDPLDELMKELELQDSAQPLTNSSPSIPSSAAMGRLRNCDKNIRSSNSCGNLTRLREELRPKRSASSERLDEMWKAFANGKPEFNAKPVSLDLCCTCGKDIHGEIITAFGKKYHAEHFLCTTCNKIISSADSFYDVNGPTCKPCYTSINSLNACAYCQLPIETNSISAIGTKWHESCFVCNHCCNPFSDGKFFAQEGMPYCPACYRSQFATLCAACGDVASGSIIKACNQTWHSQCFVCTTCKTSIDGVYFEKAGMPYCFPHYQELL
mmetsp:Transcript_11104/g.13745  ORF Transcript_11104/g.13745 Transcript_11104/m.13745 type:complete len:268 (-) Transcript_11104:32-835(-)